LFLVALFQEHLPSLALILGVYFDFVSIVYFHCFIFS
jgi:hypothetical protein